MELLTIYYDLFEILEDTEIVIEAIKELTDSRDSRSSIRQKLENLWLWHYEEELNFLYDMRMDDLKAFRVKCVKRGMQTTLEDFL